MKNSRLFRTKAITSIEISLDLRFTFEIDFNQRIRNGSKNPEERMLQPRDKQLL